MPEQVEIHYRRPPSRLEVFTQQVVRRCDDYVVTFLEHASIPRPMKIDDEVVLEPGSPIVWFTYRDRWYDVGRFHRADGTFTGFYANMLTPVDIDRSVWSTIDLFLDVWMDPDGAVRTLDEEEFDEAVAHRWISRTQASTARDHAETLMAAGRQGVWPHGEVREWTLERARQTIQR